MACTAREHDMFPLKFEARPKITHHTSPKCLDGAGIEDVLRPVPTEQARCAPEMPSKIRLVPMN